MKVDFKELKGIRANPIKCHLCSKHFSRPQTLKVHVQKIHSAENTPTASNNQNQNQALFSPLNQMPEVENGFLHKMMDMYDIDPCNDSF